MTMNEPVSVRELQTGHVFSWVVEQLDALTQSQRIEVMKALAVRYEADLKKMAGSK